MEEKKNKKKVGMYVVEDGKVYVFIIKKTRKSRVCGSCKRVIGRSENYYYVFQGGDMSGVYMEICMGCVKESFEEDMGDGDIRDRGETRVRKNFLDNESCSR